MNWYLFGACGLAVSFLLTVFFAAMCRHNEEQEPHNEREVMTPEEVVSSICTANLEILASPDSAHLNVVDLMNKAGMAGFKLGSRTAGAMFEGALAVHAARISK